MVFVIIVFVDLKFCFMIDFFLIFGFVAAAWYVATELRTLYEKINVKSYQSLDTFYKNEYAKYESILQYKIE